MHIDRSIVARCEGYFILVWRLRARALRCIHVVLCQLRCIDHRFSQIITLRVQASLREDGPSSVKVLQFGG